MISTYKEKIADIVARIISQWVSPGDKIKVGVYTFTRGEIVERLHLRDIETLVVADEAGKEQNEEIY